MKPFTSVVADFEWAEAAIGPVLISRSLLKAADHLFSTRTLPFRGADADDNQRRLARAFGVADDQLIFVRQVHGRDVLVVRENDDVPDDVAADVVVCTDRTRVAVVRVADCVPILVADRKRRAVAAIHAGWRGTVAGATTAAIEALRHLGIQPASLVAAIGPSIGPCCYQVDAPVRDALLSTTPHATGWFDVDGLDRWKLDLWEANRSQLVSAGVPEASISVARACTAHNPEQFFSYRREGTSTGRMVAAIRPSEPAGS
jgi:YfiH family protein